MTPHVLDAIGRTPLVGANVVGALRVAARLGAGKTVATIIVDSGLGYVSTDVFRGLREQDVPAKGSVR